MSEATVDQLIEDLKSVAASAEALLAATASDASERVRDARRRASDSLEKARVRLDGFEQEIKDRATAAAREVDRYVHENPWPTIAAAAGLGTLVGLLLARRS